MKERSPACCHTLSTLGIACAMLASPVLADEPAGSDFKKLCADNALDGQRFARAEKLLAARDAFTSCAVDACPGPVAADCRKWLADIVATIPSVVFFLPDDRDGSNSRAWIDGNLLVEKFDGKPVSLDPGIHEFRFEVEGQSFSRDIAIRKGEKNRRIDVPVAPRPPEGKKPAFVPGPQPKPTVGRSTSAAVYVLAGVGGVALSAAGYLGVTGLSRRSDLRDSCYPHCASGEVDAARRRLLLADIAGAVGVASLGAALWIYRDGPSDVRVGATHDGASALGSVSGSF